MKENLISFKAGPRLVYFSRCVGKTPSPNTSKFLLSQLYQPEKNRLNWFLFCFNWVKTHYSKLVIRHVSEKLVIDTLHKEEFQLTAVVIKPNKQETLQLNVNVFATGDALLYRPNLKPNIHMSNPQNCHTNH